MNLAETKIFDHTIPNVYNTSTFLFLNRSREFIHMTVLNNNFFIPPHTDKVVDYQFHISNQPNTNTLTIITSMCESEIIALFTNSQYTIKIIMNEFIAGYNTINNRYYYKINLLAKITDKRTMHGEYIELYNDSFTIYDITQILWLLNTINEYIDKSFSKIPAIEPDNISLVCFLVDYLIALSLVEFPRKPS